MFTSQGCPQNSGTTGTCETAVANPEGFYPLWALFVVRRNQPQLQQRDPYASGVALFAVVFSSTATQVCSKSPPFGQIAHMLSCFSRKEASTFTLPHLCGRLTDVTRGAAVSFVVSSPSSAQSASASNIKASSLRATAYSPTGSYSTIPSLWCHLRPQRPNLSSPATARSQ